MQTGAITSYIDVAQLVLYAFWIFFAGLIYYLHRENKREGYPLESDRSPYIKVQGFPAMPGPKEYLLAHGGTVTLPKHENDRREVAARPAAPHPGAPLEPTGDPMVDGVGPAAWADRTDTPDLTAEGAPKIVPLRVARDFEVAKDDPNPIGMDVVTADGLVAGTVRDVWVDRSEIVARYLEVEVAGSKRIALLPINYVRFDSWRRRAKVRSVMAHHFEKVPALKNADTITYLEEDKIVAFFAGGTLYAEPSRLGPWI